MLAKRKVPGDSLTAKPLHRPQTGSGSLAAQSGSKRARFSEPNSDTLRASDDFDLDEQDRKRAQQGRKGRIVIDGYDSEDSDSDQESGARLNKNGEPSARKEEDMFDLEDEEAVDEFNVRSKRPKYLKLGEIEGQEFGAKTTAPGDEEEELNMGTDDDERDPELELEDSGEDDDDVDDYENMAEGEGENREGEQVKVGGSDRKREKAKKKKGMGYKIDSFNMKAEMATGKIDEEGNYVANAKDPHAEHDSWLRGNYSRKVIRAAKEAKEKRDSEAKLRQEREENEDADEDEVKMRLVEYMRRGETVLNALQRLGKDAKEHKEMRKRQSGPSKWDRTNPRHPNQGLSPDKMTDKAKDQAEGPAAERGDKAKVHQSIQDLEAITHLSSVLMSRFGMIHIYEESYERLLEQVRKSGLVRATFDPAAKYDEQETSSTGAHLTMSDPGPDIKARMLEYKWSPSYLAAAARAAGTQPEPDAQIFGPYTEEEIKSWEKEGYFGMGGERILIREVGRSGDWSRFDEIMS